MSRIIITATPAYGHVSPMRAIAADLVRRGHQVTMLTGSAFAESVRSTGAAFAALTGKADFDQVAMTTSPERLALPSGLPRLDWDLRNLVLGPMTDQFRDLQRVIAEAGDEPVLVISDFGYLGVAPMMLGAPGPRPTAFIGIGVVPFSLSSVDTAPFGMGLPPDSSEQGRARNREAYAMMRDQVFGNARAVFAETAAQLGVTQTSMPFFLDIPILKADRFLQLAIEELSYQRSDTPENVRFVGTLPTVRPAGASAPSWWGDVEDADTVVVVTQGTVANADFRDLIEPTLAALADLPVLVIAATGRDAELSDVPANARVAEFIAFDDLLPYTDVLVTNGGFGGVQQSLRYGVPMVLAGQTEDKLEGNVRVAATGAAINLATDSPAAADIRKAVETVLAADGFRANAERLATEYATFDALEAIAGTVDELTGG